MDTEQYETPTAPVDVARPARRGRTRRVRIGPAALLTVGAVVAVHAAATAQAPSDAVVTRPHWSGTVVADYSGRWPGAGGRSSRQVMTSPDAQQSGVVDIDVVLGGTQRA